jgi:hypothetical protein
MTAKIKWLGNRAWKATHAPAVKFFALLAITLAGLTLMATCGGGGVTAGTVTLVTLTPPAQSVGLNQFVDITAQVTFSTSTTQVSTAVTWFANGVAGGNSTVGTIVPSTTDIQIGVYTAPSVVPATNNGVVSITATAPQDPSNSADTTVVTSNTASVTVGGGAGLVVSPAAASIPAGSNFPFSATLNSLPDMNATWVISSTNGGDIGEIDFHTGNYKAPNFPPPGALITVTATDAGAKASVTATIVYSDASFTGPFSFSYTGNDSLGFLAVSGSLVADGFGGITSGVEDIQSFISGISAPVQIRGNYLVGPDGRTKVTLNSGLPSASTLRFVLTNNNNPAQSLHALLTRSDANATGGGTIDQQNVNALTNVDSVISGNYVFSLLGLDISFQPLGMAGRFISNGAGQFLATASSLDVNDNGTVTSPPDKTLAGSYSFDPMFPGTGRGILTMTSTAITQRQFAFYIVDSTHLRLVEIDGKSFLAGDIYSGLLGNAFTNSSLAAANYAFTTGGIGFTFPAMGPRTSGNYAAGGIFISSGSGITSTGGAFDSNNAGTVQTNTTINACTYAVDPTTGRIDLRLNIGAGTCPAGPNASTLEYAMYQTANGSAAVMLELDSTAVSSGLAFQQQLTPSLAAGGFALNLIGQGLLHNAPASIQQVVDGQVTLGTNTVSDGTLDISIFGAIFPNDSLTTSSIVAPATNGRGTAVLAASSPSVTYNLSYYLIDDNTALLFVQNSTINAIGSIARQF